MVNCGWTHCSCGKVITDAQKKVKVGKRWYHEECAKERELIQDIITKFNEQVNTADIALLRRVINYLVYDENKPAEYVMFALDYAIEHPQMKLTFPQGLYRICADQNVLNAWCKKQADAKVGSHTINITELNQPITELNIKKTKRTLSDLFE